MTDILGQAPRGDVPRDERRKEGNARDSRAHGRSVVFGTARALGVAIALCGFASAARAQASTLGTIEGTVTDSVHARPLAGARVLAIGADAATSARGVATTDTAGRYRIDSLPAGRYVVGFESPLLDSLEVTLTPRAATVAPGAAAKVELALPPAAKLRAAVCPGMLLPPGTGALFGHVVSAETAGPLAGVALAMRWRELGFDRKTLRASTEERSASVTTDAGGWYRMCGVPTGTWVSMQLQHDGQAGPVIRALVDDTLGIAIWHLSFSSAPVQPLAATAAPDRADTSASSGSAALSGTVLGPADARVEGAEVRVRGARGATRTDAAGRYALAGLPAGTQVLEVRRVGYEIAEPSVELRSGETTTRDVHLRRVIVTLDSMRVVATRSKYPEFADHQKLAVGGLFLGPDRLMRERGSFTSDIIEKLPGFRVVRTGGRATVYSIRYGVPCRVNVVIDGVNVLTSDRSAVSVDDVQPTEIGAIEAYRAGEIAPETYDRGCGAVVIWTKR
jgi:hypothetical protein